MVRASSAAALLGPCAEIARRHDRERYLCGLFAAPDRREAVMALLAFSIEIGKTREVVSEAMLGEIRLQWWRDAVAEIYEADPRRHEVVDALADSVQRFDLPRAPLDAAIDARATDLDDMPPECADALERYAHATSGAIHKLILQVQGERRTEVIDAAEQIGTAWALVGLVRASPYLARVGRLPVPRDVLDRHGARAGDFQAGRSTPALVAALRDIVSMAESRLAGPRHLGVAAAPAVLPVVLLRRHIRAIRRPDWQPFGPHALRDAAAVPPPLAPLSLWLRARLGRY